MSGSDLATGEALPSSFVARLAQQLRACDQPLIQLWSWPWSGQHRLLDILASKEPAAWERLPPGGDLIDHLSDSSPRWLVAEGRNHVEELLAAAERLRPEQRLVLPVERRPDDEVLPQRILDPQAMRLRRSEIEELFVGAEGANLDEIVRLSDGWAGPLGWLRDRWRQGESPEVAFGTAAFAARIYQRVIRRLDPEIVDTLIDCSITEELRGALWRRVWIAQPEKLVAFERLLSEWMIVESGASPRLPRLMRWASRSRQPSPERQREVYKQLGLAAHGLGLVDEAERFLGLAGDVGRLRRLRAVAVPGARGIGAPASSAQNAGAASVATPGAGAVRGSSSGPYPRFCLHLLGQAMVRRIDAEGGEKELGWRLRRALQSVAYLALAPDRRATKEQLIDAIWRDADPESIAKNFHPTLSEARRTLGHREVFVYSQGLYILNPELGWWVDCDRFGELIEQGQRLSRPAEQALAGGQMDPSTRELEPALDAWFAAWRLYRGELLSGVEAGWIRGHRAALHRDYVELLRATGDLCARLGRLTEALDAYRSMLLEEPYEERVHLAVMELYARQGRRDLVRRQFVRMQELLIQELNVEPVAETRERYHQLMR